MLDFFKNISSDNTNLMDIPLALDNYKNICKS